MFWCSLSRFHQQLSDDLELLWSWVESGKMKLNVNKSRVMWFLLRSFHHFALPPVLINDIILQRVTVQKYLGVLIDDQLDWSAQVSNVSKKMSYYLFWINSKRKFLTPHVTRMLVDSLVLSHLQYVLPVWGPSLPQTSINRLYRNFRIGGFE